MSKKQTFSDHPFSWNGRFSRLSYLAWTGLLLAIFLTVFLFESFRLVQQAGQVSVEQLQGINLLKSFPITGVLYISSFYFFTVFVIRRFHDIDLSGWWNLLLFIPIVNFFVLYYLMFAKGEMERNRFGHYRETSMWEGFFGLFIGLTIVALHLFLIYGMFYIASSPEEKLRVLKSILLL